MLIGIDGNEANCERGVGVNKYAHEILRAMRGMSKEWVKKHKVIVYLKEKPLKHMPKESFYWKYKVIHGSHLWIIRSLVPSLYFDRPKPDVFFSPSHYVPPICPMPRVCSITDLGYLEFSEQFTTYDYWQLKLWSAWSITVSKKIIAISETTCKDIVRHYPSALKKVETTLLGYDREIYNLKMSKDDVRRIKNKYTIVNDYILFLGTLKPSKNIVGLVRAWSMNSQLFPKVDLVIAGKKGWMFDEIFREVKKLRLRERVIFTDYVSEKDKKHLIKGSKGFVLPSFWEGFGLDVVSAKASGIPTLLSDRGSLPEVGGSAAIYVDPYNVKSMADGIKKLLSLKTKEYNRLINRGIKEVEKYSWKNSARKTIKILEKAK